MNIYSEITVIVPTLNEGKSIGALISLVLEKYKGISIIVADDGSSDNTQTIVKSHSLRNSKVMLLDRRDERVKGLTASVLDAVKLAKTSYIIVIDGDLQHPPEKIGEIAEKLRKFDIVGAARKKVLVKWPINRKLISKAATLMARLRLGRKVSDPLSGFFGAKSEVFRKAIAKGRFELQGYKVFFDLVKSSPKASYSEIQYDFGLRKGGESKIRAKHILIFFRSLFK